MKKCDRHADSAKTLYASNNSDDLKNPIIFIEKTDLPLVCPSPNAPLWSLHPRVFLPIEEQGGKITCPYCSTAYQLK